jgi:uncharacterized protein (TIGR02391 family)
MAKSSEPQSRVLSLQEMEEGIRLLEARLKDLNELDLLTISNRTDPRIDGIEAAIGDTLSHVFGHGTPEYKLYRAATTIDTGPHNYAFEVPWQQIADGLRHGKERAIQLLQRAVVSLKEKSGGNSSPAARAVRAYGNLDLHPEIARAASKLYSDGHYSNAVESAVKALNGLVRLRSGLEFDGVTLMERAFSLTNPVLKFNSLADQSDKDEQRGFMQMFCGAVSGLRNPRAHKFINDEPERALEFIAFVSLLAKLLDEAKLA